MQREERDGPRPPSSLWSRPRSIGLRPAGSPGPIPDERSRLRRPDRRDARIVGRDARVDSPPERLDRKGRRTAIGPAVTMSVRRTVPCRCATIFARPSMTSPRGRNFVTTPSPEGEGFLGDVRQPRRYRPLAPSGPASLATGDPLGSVSRRSTGYLGSTTPGSGRLTSDYGHPRRRLVIPAIM